MAKSKVLGKRKLGALLFATLSCSNADLFTGHDAPAQSETRRRRVTRQAAKSDILAIFEDESAGQEPDSCEDVIIIEASPAKALFGATERASPRKHAGFTEAAVLPLLKLDEVDENSKPFTRTSCYPHMLALSYLILRYRREDTPADAKDSQTSRCTRQGNPAASRPGHRTSTIDTTHSKDSVCWAHDAVQCCSATVRTQHSS